MAIKTLNTIKNWFRTGSKPTQTQFWDTWDSFRHKNEKVPVKDVEGIDELLNSKTDESDFKTINGESILGSGNISVRSDVSTLQNISDKHGLSVYTNTGLKINNSTNGAYTEIKAEQIETRDDEGHFSTILPGHGYFKFPNKTRDLFTIATTQDITLSNAIQGGSSWNGVYFTSPLESYQSNLYISSEGTKISYGTDDFRGYVEACSGIGFSSMSNFISTGKNYLVQLQGQLGLRLSTSGNVNTVGALKTDNLTAERTFQLPDHDGILATLDDITGGTQDLQQVLNAGNVSKTKAIFDLNPEINDPYKPVSSIDFGSINVYGSHDWFGEIQTAATEITTGTIRVSRNGLTNTFLFQPQGSQGSFFYAPNKPGGSYTLATTDETNAYSFTQNQAKIAGFRTTTVSYQVPSAYTRVGNIVTMKIPVRFKIEANTNYANVQIDTGIYHVGSTAEVGTFAGASNAFRSISGSVRSNGTTAGQTLVLDVYPPSGYTDTEIFNCVAMVMFEVEP